jgi:putative ABC transport system substrate-binding protein
LNHQAVPGIDGETWREYGKHLVARIEDLHERVQRGTYRAKPSKRAWIAKAGGQRPLGMAALEDKIVQQAVRRELVDSLARPGGNITGLTRLTSELSGKRLELFKEAVPAISKVAILIASGDLRENVEDYEAAARGLNVTLLPVNQTGPKPNLEDAFQSAVKAAANALVTNRDAVTASYAKQIADLSIKHRLPSMNEDRPYVEAGGLMSYAANDAEQFRRAAYYVDRILKGAKPADLPIEQPTKFEFVINLKTAKQIGLTIPPNVLARADRVIK